MKDEDKTKVELIKEFKTLKKEREKSVINDVTERKQAEEELKDSEERLKILFDYAPDAYYISDLKGKFIDGNKAAERVIGYKREELIGKSFLKLKLLSLANISKAAKTLAKNIIGKPTGPDEFVLNRKDNSKITVEISTYPVKIKGRTLVLGIARDITERKQAIEEMEKLAKFPTENPNPVLRISKDGTVLYHNYASESLLEYWNYKEGKPLQDRWFQFVLDVFEDDDIKTADTEIGDKVFSLTFAPIVEKGFVNVYGFDITKQRQIEDKLQDYLKEIRKDRKSLKRLSKKLINAQEEERRKISETIHDDIGQNITAIKINISVIEEAIKSHTIHKMEERLIETKSLLNNVFEQLHKLSVDLRSPLLRDLGLVPALHDYVNRYKKRENIDIDFEVINLKKRLNKEIEIVIFRIVQEAFTNISKHARADNIYLRLENKKSKVFVLIKDNGKGFNTKNVRDLEELGKGLGLIEMRERIETVGGNLDIKSSLGKGTQLLIEMPVALQFSLEMPV